MDLTRPIQISTRMTSLSASWQSAKVIRTREKILFFFGVMNVLLSTLLFGLAPQYEVLYLIGHTYRSGLLGGFTFHTRFRVSIFYLCAAIDIRNVTGIISSSISATSSQFSTLPSSGFSLQARRYLLLATAFPMDLWLVQSSLGETVSFSMTRIKSRLYLSISTPHFRLR